MGLKSHKASPKIKKGEPLKNDSCSSDQHPFFSFRYMTSNANHSIAFIQAFDSNEQLKTLQGLYEALEKISSKSWMYWGGLPKRNGYEMIEYSMLNFAAASDAGLTGDTKMNIFRFNTHLGNGRGRIIGFKDSPCSAFNVIGYDFDFSAYSH